MESINIKINRQELSVSSGITILNAALENGIHIPTLCAIKGIDSHASCRMCVVEVKGIGDFKAACATKVSEGIEVFTDTPAIRKSRKITLELLLSRHSVDCHHCMRIGSSRCDDLDPEFCEMCFFCDCVRDGFCELQELAREYKVDVIPFEHEDIDQELDRSIDSIIRNPNKCVKCRRCVDVCNDIQCVENLSIDDRGSKIKIVPKIGNNTEESQCIQCGRCVDVCPTGAIFMKEHKDEMIYYAHKCGITTAAFISSNVLKKLAQLFKMEVPAVDVELVVAGLRKIGIDYVFADDVLNIMSAKSGEEALNKAIEKGKESIIITDSYASQKFVRQKFENQVSNIVAYDSTQQSFSKYVKHTLVQSKKLNIKDVRVISITEGGENVADANDNSSADFVISARELYRIFIRTGVDLKQIYPSKPDFIENSLDVGSLQEFFNPVEWTMDKEIKETEIMVNGSIIQAAVTTNLGQSKRLLEEIDTGSSKYKVIRINA